MEPQLLPLPSPCVVVLVGPVASGKSTWAAQWFEPSQVVSSDALRALVGEGEHDLAASSDAFAVLHDVVTRRVARRLTTVVDSLGLDAEQRRRWRAIAEGAGVPCIAVVFDTPARECRRRNAARPLPVRADVVANQLRRWPEIRHDVSAEPWHDVLEPEPVAVVPAALVRRRSRLGDAEASPSAASEPAPRGAMTVGLHLSSFDWPGGRARLAEHLRRIALDAESAGVAHVWLMDHLRQIPQAGAAWHDLPEPYTALAWMAAVTERLRLGVLVSPAFLRHPAIVAKQIATLDVLSGGRAICGLGVGWFEQEYHRAGVEFPPLGERYERLEDALEVLPLLWGKGSPRFDGRQLTMLEALSYPRPLQDRVPLWVGGSGELRTLRLVARYADACNLFGEPDVVARKVAALHRHCAEIGRDPSTIEVTHLSTVLIGRDRSDVARLVEELRPARRSTERFSRDVNAGTVDDQLVRAERLARAGVDTMIVRLADVADPGGLERLAAVIERLA